MPRARISYEQRVIIEDMRKNGYKARDICEALGISSYDNFIAERCNTDRETIEKILMLEDDYMRSVGIIIEEME